MPVASSLRQATCPTGKSPVPLIGPAVQPLPQKYSDFPNMRIRSIFAAVPLPHEGRFAIVTDVGRGMRWTLMALSDEGA